MHRCLRAFALVPLLIAGTVAAAITESLPADVTTVPLAIVTNDRDASVSHLQLMLTDGGAVSGIYLDTSAKAGTAPLPTSRRVYPLAGIESAEGVVLGQGQGVKAIYLKGRIASAAGEGSLVIRYLKNGVFRSWGECQLDLQRQGSDWRLINAYDGQPISQIKVETWALGISTLANVCPNPAA